MINIVQNIEILQQSNPHIYLCGSAALIYVGLLPERIIGDIDFVLHSRNKHLIKNIHSLKRDPYPNQPEDKCLSYHGYIQGGISVNLLVFDDDVMLTVKTIKYNDSNIRIQNPDDILFWKQKYNRDKDIKDLNNIANKLIEDELVKP